MDEAEKKQPKFPHLSDSELQGLEVKYGKIGVIEYNEHQLVFRRPTRDHVRDYRRKQDSPVEKADAMDQLAQQTIVAFDGDQDVNKARTTFTGSFLEQFPLAISNPRFVGMLTALAGLIEEEDAKNLGKGVTVSGVHLQHSPKG